MRILLVYPEFPDTFWSFKHALKFVSKRASYPPLGLLTVAAMLPAEWEKRLVDMNVAQLTGSDLAWADYVFLSAMIVQRDDRRRLAVDVLRHQHIRRHAQLGGRVEVDLLAHVAAAIDLLDGLGIEVRLRG